MNVKIFCVDVDGHIHFDALVLYAQPSSLRFMRYLEALMLVMSLTLQRTEGVEFEVSGDVRVAEASNGVSA